MNLLANIKPACSAAAETLRTSVPMLTEQRYSEPQEHSRGVMLSPACRCEVCQADRYLRFGNSVYVTVTAIWIVLPGMGMDAFMLTAMPRICRY